MKAKLFRVIKRRPWVSAVLALIAGACTAEAANSIASTPENMAKKNFAAAMAKLQEAQAAQLDARATLIALDAERTAFRTHLANGTCDKTFGAALKQLDGVECRNGRLVYTLAGRDYTANGQMVSALVNPLDPTRSSLGSISSDFGPRKHPITGRDDNHEAVDLHSRENGVAASKPVYAAHAGCIVKAETKGKYGRMIEVSDGTISTRYAHLKSYNYDKGLRCGNGKTFVEQGQLIGMTGASGSAEGIHLHYEVRLNGKLKDPVTMHTGGYSAAVPEGIRNLVNARIEGTAKALEQYAAKTYDRTLEAGMKDYEHRIVKDVVAAWQPVHAAKSGLIAQGWTAADVDAITEECQPEKPCTTKALHTALRL